DLLQRRDQRVVEHPLGLQALLEPVVHAVTDGGRVAHERLLVEQLQDLFVGHSDLSVSKGHAAFSPSWRGPSRRPSDRASPIRTCSSWRIRRGVIRSVGPEMLRAATTSPPAPRTGTATAASPVSSSSTVVANPCRRTVSSSASSCAGSVI